MKNKAFIYILIPLVIFIWGLIIVKVFRHINPLHIPENASQSFSLLSPAGSVGDTMTLILDYRDPFLNGKRSSVLIPDYGNDFESNKDALSKTEKPAVLFPVNRYSGLVINSKSKQKLGMISIDNKDYLIKEGNLIAGEKILKLYADSVIVVFKKTKRTFLRNK